MQTIFAFFVLATLEALALAAFILGFIGGAGLLIGG